MSFKNSLSTSSVKEISIDLANKKIDQFFPFSEFVANQILSCHSEHINLALDMSKNSLLSSTLKKWFEELVDKLVNTKTTVKISKLTLYNNKIDTLEFINYNTLQFFDNLTEIYLETNSIETFPELSLKTYCKILTKIVELNSNHLELEQFENFIEKFSFSELRVLGLANVRLKKVSFVTKNKTFKKLLMLNLKNNEINDINLSECTFENTLYQLELGNVLINKKGGNMFTSSFIGVNKFENLSKLDLSNNQINSAEGLQFLEMNSNLSILKLSYNNICFDRFFARLNCKKLRELELKNNKLVELSDRGLRRSSLKDINRLELNENLFSGQFIKEIITGLEMNKIIFLIVWNRHVVKAPQMATFPELKKNLWKDLKYYDYS